MVVGLIPIRWYLIIHILIRRQSAMLNSFHSTHNASRIRWKSGVYVYPISYNFWQRIRDSCEFDHHSEDTLIRRRHDESAALSPITQTARSRIWKEIGGGNLVLIRSVPHLWPNFCNVVWRNSTLCLIFLPNVYVYCYPEWEANPQPMWLQLHICVLEKNLSNVVSFNVSVLFILTLI